MDEFEYVMVLVSIIMGLGITHILFGLGGLIDRLSGPDRDLRLSLAHATWLGFLFAWMVMFWWWEFRFSQLPVAWTMGLYLFLIGYSIALFLLAVVLVPRSWDRVTTLDDFFLQRRAWFYSLLLVITGLDVIDTCLKGGWEYTLSLGPWAWAFWLATVPVAVVGFRSANIRHHAVMGSVFLVWQILVGFESLPSLGL